MIFGIGIDSVEINRFSDWHAKSHKTLQRIFSSQEIDYCLEKKHLSAERFALRFAVREAIFKALSNALPNATVPLLTLCKATTITRNNNGRPAITIQWRLVLPYVPKNFDYASVTWHLSCTHTKTIATAYVVACKS